MTIESDVIQIACALVENHIEYESDTWDRCYHCGSIEGCRDEQTRHVSTCPVLIAKDLLTGVDVSNDIKNCLDDIGVRN